MLVTCHSKGKHTMEVNGTRNNLTPNILQILCSTEERNAYGFGTT